MIAQQTSQPVQNNAFLVWRIETMRQKEAQERVYRGVIFRRHATVQ